MIKTCSRSILVITGYDNNKVFVTKINVSCKIMAFFHNIRSDYINKKLFKLFKTFERNNLNIQKVHWWKQYNPLNQLSVKQILLMRCKNSLDRVSTSSISNSCAFYIYFSIGSTLTIVNWVLNVDEHFKSS